jgi:hypothetical protein
MKKLISLISCALMILSLSLVASAAGVSTYGQDILNLLKAPIYVDSVGQKLMVPTAYVNQAENYLLTHDITKEQHDQIITEINKEYALVLSKKDEIILSGGSFNLKNLDTATKNEILQIGKDAANVVNLNLVYDGVNIVITEKADSTKVVFSNSPIIKNTGKSDVNYGFILITIFSGLIATAFVYSLKNNLFSKIEG